MKSPSKATTFGPAYDEAKDGPRLRHQRKDIEAVLLKAPAVWRTLAEMEAITGYPQASISAQLRHLRKPAFGGYQVLKRRRGAVGAGTWEYKINIGELFA